MVDALAVLEVSGEQRTVLSAYGLPLRGNSWRVSFQRRKREETEKKRESPDFRSVARLFFEKVARQKWSPSWGNLFHRALCRRLPERSL